MDGAVLFRAVERGSEIQGGGAARKPAPPPFAGSCPTRNKDSRTRRGRLFGLAATRPTLLVHLYFQQTMLDMVEPQSLGSTIRWTIEPEDYVSVSSLELIEAPCCTTEVPTR